MTELREDLRCCPKWNVSLAPPHHHPTPSSPHPHSHPTPIPSLPPPPPPPPSHPHPALSLPDPSRDHRRYWGDLAASERQVYDSPPPPIKASYVHNRRPIPGITTPHVVVRGGGRAYWLLVSTPEPQPHLSQHGLMEPHQLTLTQVGHQGPQWTP